MEIIDPILTTDARLLFCDLPASEATAPEWDPLVNYVTGQRVSVNSGGYHVIYQCTWHTPDCLNKFPPDYLEGSVIYWMKVSATNRWKLFDLIVSPERAYAGKNTPGITWGNGCSWQPGKGWRSTGYSSITALIKPGKKIDTVSLMNVDADSVTVIMTDPVAGEVYNETETPAITIGENLIYSDLPNYPNASIQIIIRNANECYCGEIIIGSLKTIGTAKYGVEVSIIDYSIKVADEFGNFTIVERAFSKRISTSFSMPAATHAAVLRVLEKYRATPLVWIIDDSYSTTIAYGFYNNLQMGITNNINAEGSVSIEGLGADYVHATPIPDEWVPPWDGLHHINVLALPSFTLSASKIEETPAAKGLSLIVLAVPTAAIATTLFELGGADGICTISNAAPAVIACAGNGFSEGQEILFQTTGVLPLPFVAGTHYYVKNAGDSFNASLTPGGSTIDTTTSGSGIHKVLGKV